MMEDEWTEEPGYTPEQIEKKTNLFKNREFFIYKEFSDPLNKLIQRLVYDLTPIDAYGNPTTADPHEVCNRLANSKVLQRLSLKVVQDHEEAWLFYEHEERLALLRKNFEEVVVEIEKSEYAPD